MVRRPAAFLQVPSTSRGEAELVRDFFALAESAGILTDLRQAGLWDKVMIASSFSTIAARAGRAPLLLPRSSKEHHNVWGWQHKFNSGRPIPGIFFADQADDFLQAVG